MLKYKDLNKKKKIEYIFYYYKWHIIVSILLIAFGINIVNNIIHGDEKNPLFTISLQGISTKYEEISAWEEDISARIKKLEKDKNKTVRVDFYYIDMKNQDEYSMANIKKFIALSITGDLDIVCLDEDFFMSQVNNKAYIPLDTISELDLILDKNKDILVKLKAEGDTKERVYGIRADNINIFQNIDYDTTNKILAISKNTKNLNYIIQFFNLIFSNQ
ncbi:hypothetical protein [Defluviitalea phaphyphila]|uniref:hypothetical protein n=1 Tax=Defluviitalea phaphyphila TaxID=1473580 RepID=UPI0007319D70|nr:hypothetical protein [Defluviitalea phaphyphila]